ncbi:hypothetical protein AGLY_018022 [Aphis glycines]|uniref:Uncharacterized protein n=1 Tax=Aphis glycines TaxID=307491 RepID=A0A6G0STS8_APHGL|nr:hypothetical protein AGLY_018022 [Aphis glycines]
MDFEFSMVNKTNMVVISGAISNSLDRFKIRKLEGQPLLLPLNEEARPMGETELQVAVKELKRVFRVKTELRDACLDQLKQSLSSTKNNLTKGYIDSYIRRGTNPTRYIKLQKFSGKIFIFSISKFFRKIKIYQLQRVHGGTFGNESLLKKTAAERQLQRLRKRKESTVAPRLSIQEEWTHRLKPSLCKHNFFLLM